MGLNSIVGTAIFVICVFGWAVHSFNFRYSKKILKWTRFEAKREPWDIIHPVQSSNPYEKRYNSGFKTVTEYNWKYGMCKHQIIFEVRNCVVTQWIRLNIRGVGYVNDQTISLLRKSSCIRIPGRKGLPYSSEYR